MLTFTTPWWLVVLLFIPPFVWWSMTRTRTNFNARQQKAQALLRSCVLSLLSLALAQPVIHRGTDRLSIVYLVDASHSVSASALASAAERISALNADLTPEHFAILAFAGSVVPVPDADTLATLEGDAAIVERLERGETALGPALDAARRALLPGHAARIVLFSDGHGTDDTAERALARLADEQIAVSTYPSAVRQLGDSWVDAVRVAGTPVAGEQADIIVTMGAQGEARGRLELLIDGEVTATQNISIGDGLTDVPVISTFPLSSFHHSAQLEARWRPVAQAFADNDVRRTAVEVRPATRVLYVEGRPASARYLRNALERDGMDVTLAQASELPADRDAYRTYDAVVVSDVDRKLIADAQMAALEQWVREDGGGFVMIGGESVYGKDGYNDTVVEDILPVTFEIRDKPEDVAVVIVFDKSWSMAGPKIELSKEAALAAVDVLADNHQIGFVTFNHLFDWTVKLMEVGPNRERIASALRGIEPSGHTIIYPAIEQAYLSLQQSDARVKHVILMSDGRSYADQYEALVKKMVDEKMTVSTIAVGTEADRELLRNIAVWGKGRNYEVDDPREVPQVFVKETEASARPALSEEAFRPTVVDASLFEGVDVRNAPELNGYTGTKLKDTATELMATDREEPLLAIWPYGLGRTAVFASDAKDRWASRWISWRGYGPFWTRVVRAVRRQATPPLQLTLDTERAPGGLVRGLVRLDARTEDGGYQNLLRPSFTLRDASGAEQTLDARQTAPGTYVADIALDATTGYEITTTGATATGATEATGATKATILVPANYPDEYRFRAPDPAALSALAVSTGGHYEPGADALRPGADDRSTVPTRLWPLLLVLALIGYLADLLLRRVRIFEREEFA